MESTLSLSLIQADISWKNISENMEYYGQILAGLPASDLILFPEMFLTGFIMDPGSVDSEQKNVIDWLKQQAQLRDSTLICTHPFYEGGQPYNRLLSMDPDGRIEKYDKRHLFAIGGEKDNYRAGKDRLIIEKGSWKMMPLICYDLRFPVWSRNIHGYDLLIYLANWPAERMLIWETLLRARAIENQCFVVGVNRVGKDGNGISYTGNSLCCGPDGQIICSLDEHEGQLSFELRRNDLLEFRKRYPFLGDRDNFELITGSGT